MIKVVLDTNVYLAALIKPQGVCARVLAKFDSAHFQLICSELILKEIFQVSGREKFTNYFSVVEVKKLIAGIRDKSLLIATAQLVGADLSKIEIVDLFDQIIISAFIASKADFLVTGNKKHFLSLGEQVLTPREFIERFD